MLEALKSRVCKANLQLVKEGLVFDTWGNVSGVDRKNGVMVIKPSGVSYSTMKAKDMVVVSLETGEPTEEGLRPSSDTPTHLELYRVFENIAGVVHTHSLFATAWAQACRDIPPMGTTHADFCFGPIPCTRPLSKTEVEGDYEINTGRVIIERFAELNPAHVPAVLVAQHGPFTWGDSPMAAVKAAATLEQIANMARQTAALSETVGKIPDYLLNRHFLRKHGPDAYYGQK